MVDDLRTALDRVLTGDAGQRLGAVVRDALRPVIEQAFRAGFRAGVEMSLSAAERAMEATLRVGEQTLRSTLPAIDSERSADSQKRPQRGRRRVAHGTLRTLTEMILGEQPGLRITEAQEAAQAFDNTISPTSVGNEIRRHEGTRYRREGKRWFLIGDPKQALGLDRGNTIPGLETGGGEAESTASSSSVGRAA